MKGIIYVKTSSEAYQLANKLSDKVAVLICDNMYESDKKFNGVIIKVGE